MIVIVDKGTGNVGSISNMLARVGASARVSSDPAEVAAADKLILPGVGAFDDGMQSLDERGLIPALHEAVLERRTPILGICLGMQLMGRRSEEGERAGLGWIDAESVRFRFDDVTKTERSRLRVPHMGWNELTPRRAHPLFDEMESTPRFYFVHSYHVVCDGPEQVLAGSCYGREFTAAVVRDHIVGVQFHPEKSHRFGMRLLRNFVERC
jgi:imidazole glycerol-phosphate synthase subunit HisH